MHLPTSAEVLAATRHVASFAAGAVTVFGLSGKLNPDQIQAAITAAGTALNDIIILVGLITTLVSGFIAARSASPAQQIISVKAMPEVSGVVTMPTPEGKALAESIPGNDVAAAGTPEAAAIATK